MARLELKPPLWYGISSRSDFPGLDPLRYLEILFQTRAHILQWRERDLPEEVQRECLRRGAQLARERGKIFLVSREVSLALEEGLDGVHLPSREDPAEARRLAAQAQRPFLVGHSAHSVWEALRSAERGADYVLLSPVFEPLSKEASRFPLGMSGLREAVQMLPIPVFALGGVDQSTFPEVVRTGAVGGAGISWLRQEIEERLRPSQPPREGPS